MNGLPLVVAMGLVFALGARNALAQVSPLDGQALYREHCRTCHGSSGVPPQRMAVIYKNIAPFDSTFRARHSEDSIVAVMQRGAGRDMKAFKDKLTPEQMRTVAQYVRTLGAPKTSGALRAP